MSSYRDRYQKLMTLFIKFAVAGAMASVVNFAVFNALFYWGFSLDEVNPALPEFKSKSVISDMVAYASGITFNFMLHKRFIFKMERSAMTTMVLYILVSLGGMGLSALLTYWFIQMIFFATHPEVMKILTMGLVFIYNFFSKRFAFEKRVFSVE